MSRVGGLGLAMPLIFTLSRRLLTLISFCSCCFAHFSMESLHERLLSTKYLSNVRCFRRFLDVNFVHHDMADSSSLISKRLTDAEKAAVLEERIAAVQRCVNGYQVDLPYLYKIDLDYVTKPSRFAADFQKASAASAAGPYQGVKASESHH